jgi:hypothetical protein
MTTTLEQIEAVARAIANDDDWWEDYTLYAERAIDTITRLTAENEKLRAALRECEAELNAYYRMEYPGDHPYSQQELALAMASNPATVALKENNDDQV